MQGAEEVTDDLRQIAIDGGDEEEHDIRDGMDEDFSNQEESDFTEDEEDVEVRRDLQQFGIYRALPVHGEPDFASGPPTSAEEYLRRVRHEAASLPDVVTSSIDPRAYDAHRTQWAPPAEDDIPQAPDFARPSEQWVVQLLHDFAGVRADLQRAEAEQSFERVSVPSEGDHGSWRTFCFGGEAAGAPPRQPTMPVLMAIDQVQCTLLLKWHSDWAAASRGLTQTSATWLYALTARLERPLTQGAMASLRSLLRHCARLRAGVKDPNDPLLANLNILIAITGGFFGQDETLAGIWENTEV